MSTKSHIPTTVLDLISLFSLSACSGGVQKNADSEVGNNTSDLYHAKAPVFGVEVIALNRGQSGVIQDIHLGLLDSKQMKEKISSKLDL